MVLRKMQSEPPELPLDRRASDRFPIEREVRYRVLLGRGINRVGSGVTRNISSKGLLFTTEDQLPLGERAEVSVNWPAQLNNCLPLKFVAFGRLVRTETHQAALMIEKYEFKTLGSLRMNPLPSK